MCPRRQLDELECAQKFKVDLAFKMLSCGRTELVPHALQLLPDTKVHYFLHLTTTFIMGEMGLKVHFYC